MTRYIIVDYMHLAFKTKNVQALSTIPKGSPTLQRVDTTIQTYTIKNIWTYSNRGRFPTAVCFEGGCPTRKEYFKSLTAPADKNGKVSNISYKDGRGYLDATMREGIDSTINILNAAGVSLYRTPGYEADDFIYTLVCMLKDKGITDPIDVITNDRDMLPLVDDQVSVYIRSNRQFNEAGCPSLANYFQVTPRSWDNYIYYASEYKGYTLPYNSVLLYKMLHGDKSDNIPALVKGYGGKKLTGIVETMQTANVAFDKLFRYGLSKKPDYPNFLELFFPPDVVDGMMKIYKGIDLMRVEPANGTINMPVTPQYGRLMEKLDSLNIHIPAPY